MTGPQMARLFNAASVTDACAAVPPAFHKMAFQSDSTPGLPSSALRTFDNTPAELTSGALPTARLMQWIGDDEAAVDFSVLWASVVVPIASLVDWRMTAIVLIPIVIRLAQRRFALRRLMQNGISSRSIQQALRWVDDHQERVPGYTGWKRLLRRTRSAALLATAGALLTNFALIAFKPWEWSSAGQTAFDWFLTAFMWLVSATVALVVTDAVITPRPIFAAFRAKAHGWWRSWIGKHYVEPFVEADSYQLLAEREVESIVASGRRR